MWNRENLEKITSALRAAGTESWPRLCKELGIRSGRPNNVIVDATYGSKTTADYYQFEPNPYYDESKNLVVVENPWSTVHSVVMQQRNFDYPVFGGYIELDAEVAIKILVLGVP